MYNSERMMKAIGNISDDKIEKVSRALGYQRIEHRTSRAPKRMGRVLSIAAVVALILALGVTAYAIYIHWSRGMEQRLPTTDTNNGEQQLLLRQSPKGYIKAQMRNYVDWNGLIISRAIGKLKN